MKNDTTDYPTPDPIMSELLSLHAGLSTEARNCTNRMDEARLQGETQTVNSYRMERGAIEMEMDAVAEMIRRRQS